MVEGDMPDTRKGLTLRSVLIGLAVVVFVDVWATYAEMSVRASRMTLAHFPLALFATLLILLGVNRLLPRLGLSALATSEFLVILSMGFVGAVIPVEGVVGFLLGIISSLYYFASPENQWAQYYHPYLPQWLVPQGNRPIWDQFFEGGSGGVDIPWGMSASLCMVMIPKRIVSSSGETSPGRRFTQRNADFTDQICARSQRPSASLFFIGVRSSL